MTEIKKMYEKAGIEPRKNCYYWDCPYSTGNVGEDDKKEKDCENCNNPDKETYLPFTAEKQITLWRFLATNKIGEDYAIAQFHWDNIAEQYYFYLQVPPDCYHAHDEKFEVAFAKLVNLVWEILTEEEKQQIKEILE